MRKTSFIISIILIALSIYLYVIKSFYWYHPATIGIWLFFDYLSHTQNNKTTFDLLIKKDYKNFIKIFIILAISGSLIELIGNYILNLWHYPYLSPIFLVITIPLFYPFILMSFREMHNFIKSILICPTISVIVSILLGIIIWEIPNIYSKDWVYTVPLITQEILNINIIVIIGWIILILGPGYVYKLFRIPA